MGATATPATRGLVNRAIRAARLDESVYEEVEADKTATMQAATVVAIGAVAGGLAYGSSPAAVAARAAGLPESTTSVLVLTAIVTGLIGWATYAYVAFLVGTKLMPGPQTHADWGQLARTMGYASSPRALLVLGIIPGLFGLVSTVVGLWVLVTTVIALRSALDISTGRAVGVTIVSVIALVVVTVAVAVLLETVLPA